MTSEDSPPKNFSVVSHLALLIRKLDKKWVRGSATVEGRNDGRILVSLSSMDVTNRKKPRISTTEWFFHPYEARHLVQMLQRALDDNESRP